LALGPDDISAEIRPLAGREVAEANQVDLRFVFEEELRGEPERQPEGKESGQREGNDDRPA